MIQSTVVHDTNKNDYFYRLCSYSKAESLIRYFNSKGYGSTDIAIICSDLFKFQVDLHCSGNLNADFYNNHKDVMSYYKVVFTTKDISDKNGQRYKILLNSDDRELNESRYDEVYRTYTDTEKNKEFKVEYSLLSEIPERKWVDELLFDPYYSDEYRYLYLKEKYAFILCSVINIVII